MISKLHPNSPYVLFLPLWYPSGTDPQLGVFIQKHARAAALSMNVVVIYITGDAELKEKMEVYLKEENGVTEFTGYFRKSKGMFGRLLNLKRYIDLMLLISRQVFQTFGIPKLIHSHVLLRTALIARYFSRKFGVPYIHTEHWTGFTYGAYSNKSFVYRYLCRSVIFSASALTGVSKALLDSMKKYALHCKRTVILPNVIEVSANTSKLERNGNNICVLTVADLVERNKNISGTLKVLANVRKDYPELEFHIIGGGPDEAKLRELAVESGVPAPWVNFHGRQDNAYVLKFLQSADFLITNSNIETFSVITAEAIAAGVPVIATRSGGPEYFVDDSNGILIDPGDEQALERAVRTMIKAYQQYDPQKISEAIRNRYGLEAVGKQIESLYKSVLTR